MLLVLIPSLLFIVSLILCRYWKDRWNSAHAIPVFGAAISGILLLLLMIMIPVSRITTYAAIERFEAICASYQEDSLSNTSWNVMVANKNAELAARQYYNTIIWDWLYPDAIMEVQPLGDRCHKQ